MHSHGCAIVTSLGGFPVILRSLRVPSSPANQDTLPPCSPGVGQAVGCRLRLSSLEARIKTIHLGGPLCASEGHSSDHDRLYRDMKGSLSTAPGAR